MNNQIKYAIYPSLLDAYVRYKKHDDDETFVSLFNKINKVKTEQTEQQLMGVEFENAVNARIDGIPYTGDQFPIQLVNGIADKLRYAVKKQEYLEAITPTHLGLIKLYGIADYSFPEMILDLKTTGNYKYGKYKDNSQHPVYSLIKKLNGNPIKALKYLATDFERMYLETYIPNPNMHLKLMDLIFEFIAFIEHYRELVTNGKIFGLEELKLAA